MQIVHVPPRYFPAISGAEFYLQRTGEILSRHHRVIVHATNALDFKALFSNNGKTVSFQPSGERINGVEVYRHPIDYDPTYICEQRAFFRSKFHAREGMEEIDFPGPFSTSLAEALKAEVADVFHATCLPYTNIFIALTMAKAAGIPCIVTPFYHGENPRYGLLDASLLGHFDLVLACSNEEARKLNQAGVSMKKIARVTMGVDIEPFQEADPAPFYRATGLVPGKHRIVLFCGYKNREKGAITMLRSFPLVHESFPDARFVMIGPPTRQYNIQYRRLGRLKQGVVNINPASLSGYFDKIKLGAFAAAEIYAMPSRSDAYGIAYLEAWASRLPVVTADIPAMKELVKQGVTGLQVPFDDPVALARVLSDLLGDPDMAKEMGNRGHEKVRQEGLTWERVAGRLMDLYARIASK